MFKGYKGETEMKSIKIGASLGALVLLMSTSGCATYYEDLMSNQQLIAASCSELATEEAKIQSNVDASNQGTGLNIFGALAMAYVETESGTDGTATAAMADGAGATSELSASWAEKKELIGRVRAKKGC